MRLFAAFCIWSVAARVVCCPLPNSLALRASCSSPPRGRELTCVCPQNDARNGHNRKRPVIHFSAVGRMIRRNCIHGLSSPVSAVCCSYRKRKPVKQRKGSLPRGGGMGWGQPITRSATKNDVRYESIPHLRKALSKIVPGAIHNPVYIHPERSGVCINSTIQKKD